MGPYLARVTDYRARGRARHALGDFAGAFLDYGRAIEREPHRAELYNERGGALHALKDFAGAIANYDRALALNPRFCAAYISRGNARFHKRDVAGASADYLAAFALDPELAASELARILAQNQRQDAADVLENSRKHLRINPRDFVAHGRRGLTLLLEGREAEARVDIDRVTQLAPEWREPLRLLVEAVRRRAT